MKRYSTIKQLRKDRKEWEEWKEKWRNDFKKYRKRHPEKYRERRNKSLEKLSEKHGVANLWQYKKLKYSSPDFKPNKRQRKIIRKLAKMSVFEEAVMRNDILKKYGVTYDQASIYMLTRLYKELRKHYLEKVMNENLVSLKRERRRQFYGRLKQKESI